MRSENLLVTLLRSSSHLSFYFCHRHIFCSHSNAETLMDVVWIFHKILRIIYEKKDFKERVEFGMDICARSFVVVVTNVITAVVGRRNVFTIFRKTYISDENGGWSHKLHTIYIVYLALNDVDSAFMHPFTRLLCKFLKIYSFCEKRILNERHF